MSHSAPYNHFADKRTLLAAVAVAGFEDLAVDMAKAAAVEVTPKGVVQASGMVYCRFGLAHPALYRLMFGSTLKGTDDHLPDSVFRAAGAARAVLERIIQEGAEAGQFAAPPGDNAPLECAVIAAWSLVHGLTMLLIDRLPGKAVMAQPEQSVAAIIRSLFDGLGRR